MPQDKELNIISDHIDLLPDEQPEPAMATLVGEVCARARREYPGQRQASEVTAGYDLLRHQVWARLTFTLA